MARFNPKNERIKRPYFRFLREADQKADSTIRSVEKAILRFENHTGFADFATYNSTQAVEFKKALSEAGLSKATSHSTVNALKRFFKWLACQPGYKSKIHLPDIEYLNLPEKDVRAAKEPRYRDFPHGRANPTRSRQHAGRNGNAAPRLCPGSVHGTHRNA